MIRKFLLSLLFILSVGFVRAQEFAPVGAEWYHNMQYGIFHEVSAKDTIVNNISCRNISQVAVTDWKWYALGLRVHSLNNVFIYNNADTVFVYNEFFKKFTPLYVFNVHDGDTVTLPSYPGAYSQSVTDSSFTFVVDSVRMVQYDTTILKTVYTTSLNVPGKATFSWDGAYAQRIGSLKRGLLPFCNTCVYPLSDNVQYPGALRCYHDASLSVKLVPDDCAKNIVEHVSGIQSHTLSIYPNPVQDKLYVEHPGGNIEQLRIIDLQGRIVQSLQIDPAKQNTAIDLSLVHEGIYLLEFVEAGEVVTHKKIVVAR